MTDFRALCAELMDAIDSGIPVERIKQSPLAVRVDAALAQREPQGVSKEQALEQLDGIATVFRMTYGGNIVCDKILAALEALPE
jgi:hypothetical protein